MTSESRVCVVQLSDAFAGSLTHFHYVVDLELRNELFVFSLFLSFSQCNFTKKMPFSEGTHSVLVANRRCLT